MEDALQLLSRNKENAVEELRGILKSSSTRFSIVQTVITAVVNDTARSKISANLDHLAKYIELVDLILENEHHREHLGVPNWQNLVKMLVNAGQAVIETGLEGSQLSTAIREVLRGLYLLLKADESVDASAFDGIAEILRQTLANIGHRETTAHIYLMGCVRHLTYFGAADVADVASRVLELERIRNLELIYEILLYSCFVGQPWSTLTELSLAIIPSHHVEFLPAPEFGLRNFRPSAEADLVSFIAGKALANHERSHERKRPREDMSPHFAMMLAFRGNLQQDETADIREWLESSHEDPFWGLVALGLAEGNANRGDANRDFDIGMRFLGRSPSGAGFLLSKLVNSADINKLASLLNSRPRLTSGTLVIYNALHRVSILDQAFQLHKQSALSDWFQAPPDRLLTELFDSRLHVDYFQRQQALDLRMVTQYSEMMLIKNRQKQIPQTPASKTPMERPRNRNWAFGKPQNLRDSLLVLANAALNEESVPDFLFRSHTPAFSNEDLKALCWFSGLANSLGWAKAYTEEALKLTDWDSPTQKYASISTAVSLLAKPSPVVAFVISGTETPELKSMVGKQFLDLQRLVQSYIFRRSPWFCRNLCRLVGIKRDCKESQQLQQYLLKFCLSQSEFSTVKKSYVEFVEENAEVLASMSENLRFMVLPSFCKDEYQMNDVGVFEDKFSAALFLAGRRQFSVAQLSPTVFDLDSYFPELGLKSRTAIASAFAVPLAVRDQTVVIPERSQIFLKPFFSIDLSLSGPRVAAIVEQVLKECYYGSDLEKARTIELSYLFVKSHGNVVEVWENFVYNAAATIEPSRDKTSLKMLETCANNLTQHRSIGIAAALNSVGLPIVALRFLTGEFMTSLHLNSEFISLLDGSSAEVRLMCIQLLANDEVDGLGESDLDATDVEKLLLWSEYLGIKNKKWLAQLGRLGAHHRVDFTRPYIVSIQKDQGLFGGGDWSSEPSAARKRSTVADDSHTVLADFNSLLIETCSNLPYIKKRVLNTYFQRALPENVYSDDIFGPKKWQLEMKFRPATGPQEHGEVFEIAQELADLSLRILKKPEFGPGVVKQVPELLDEVIPALVAMAFNRFRDEEQENRLRTLVSSACVNTTSPWSCVKLALDIHQQCYQRCLPSMLSETEVVHACFRMADVDPVPYSELGSMAIELIWNREQVLPNDDLLKCMRRFLQELSKVYDPAYVKSLPDKDSVPTLSEITSTTASNWQHLQAMMVYNEVKGKDSIGASFEQAGLWNLAQRVENSSNINDLEKAWWLQQWGAYNADTLYEHGEFGPLIEFLDEKIGAESALAKLTEMHTPMIASLASIVYDEPVQFVRDEIALRGYEMRALRQGRHGDVIKVLCTACEHFRSEKDIPKLLEYAAKLEENTGADNAIVSRTENAHIQWILGQQSSAIENLKGLLSGSNESALADIYCQIGTWSREARNEPDRKILESYFLEAVKYIQPDNAEKIRHEFAKFCSEAYQDQYLTSSIEDTDHIVKSLRPQYEQIKSVIKTDSFDDAKKRKLDKMLTSVHAQWRASAHDLRHLEEYKKSLLLRCAENYILSMSAGDTYEEDMASFVSLWMANTDNNELNELILNMLKPANVLPVHKFLPWISQLSSRLSAAPSPLQKALQSVIRRTARTHPYHTLWYLLKMTTVSRLEQSDAKDRAEAATEIVQQVAHYQPEIVNKISQFFRQLLHLGSIKASSNSSSYNITTLLGRKQADYWRSILPRAGLPIPTAFLPISHTGDYSNIAVISRLVDPVKIANGLSRPLILQFVDSKGAVTRCILKTSSDDLRQDAIMEQVFSIASQILSVKSRHLYVRTYKVIPLNATTGLIEFVQNTNSLMDVLTAVHSRYGPPSEYSVQKARQQMYASMNKGRESRIAAYKEVMEHTLPQMRHYWTEQFRDAASWLAAKTRWSRSSAVMSVLGYIIGLGDRHCSNLLVDSNTGDVVHIDLGIAFDQGKLLSIPETVPFRLTRDVVDGMGISGTNGVFLKAAEITLQLLRSHESRIMTVLEVLKHDTLYTWKLPESAIRAVRMGDDDSEYAIQAPRVDDGQADHALFGVRSKLQESLSSEATIRDLVTQARDPDNLALIYWGWTPFY